MEQNNKHAESTTRMYVKEIRYADFAVEPGDNPPTEGAINVCEYTGAPLEEEVWSAIFEQLWTHPTSCLVSGTWEGEKFQHKFLDMAWYSDVD